jgi:Rieske Fe-S protein
MKIVQSYSHLNGLEFLQIHHAALWAELQQIVEDVPVPPYRTSAARQNVESVKLVFQQAFIHHGWEQPSRDSDQVRADGNLVKDRVAVKVQFGDALNTSDLFAQHLVSYMRDEIDVGIEILPMKALQSQMSSGVAYYEGEFIALSLRCTHLGCSINWEENKKRFICPCHSSAFDISGEVLNPPASRALDYYPVLIEKGVVKVDIGTLKERKTTGKDQFTYA